LGLAHYGVGMARRGWAPADHILNTWPMEELLQWLEHRGHRKPKPLPALSFPEPAPAVEPAPALSKPQPAAKTKKPTARKKPAPTAATKAKAAKQKKTPKAKKTIRTAPAKAANRR
jgi:hypothetical protein